MNTPPIAPSATQPPREQKNTTDNNLLWGEVYSDIQAAIEALPEAAIERTKGVETKKGYDTTGYGYQYLVNILNEVVGVDNWGYDYKVVKEQQGAYKSGTPYYDVTVEITIDILNARRVHVGGHQSKTYGDALKGAITNAFKKTVAMFGVGKQVYEGTLDDDNQHQSEDITPVQATTPPVAPAPRPNEPFSGQAGSATPEVRPGWYAFNCEVCGKSNNSKSLKRDGSRYSVCYPCNNAKDYPNAQQAQQPPQPVAEPEIDVSNVPF